jgi:hypothetical protein
MTLLPPQLSPEEIATQKLASEREAALIARHVAEIMKTHGPPPLIIGEDPKDFGRVLVKLVRARCSNNDAFLQNDIWDMAVANLMDKRYDRASSLVLNRRIRKNLDFQKQRPKQKLAEVSNNATPYEDRDDRSAEERRKDKLRNVIEDTPREVGHLLDQATLEEANACAFEEALPVLTAIDDLKTRNFFRRNVSRQMWGERRPAYIPPLAIIEHRLHFERAEESRREWLLDDMAQEQAEKEAQKQAQGAKPEEQQDLPTVSAPKLEQP